MKILQNLFTAFLIAFLLSCSNDDEPQIITETITVRDTITVVQHDTSIVVQNDTTIIIIRDTTVIVQVDTIVDMISNDSTAVVICVRHAETASGSDPSLSAAGQIRAIDLAHALSNLDLSSVYSSNFNRTKQTAMTVADDQSLSVEIYNAFNISSFASGLLEDHKGQIVLAVGHSNTTPQLINLLTGTTNYADFNENSYDNLFIVSVRIDGVATVYHLEYGADTP
jgi:broad specificity phosphatase PhoE